jgi:hypothetical protein
MECKSWRPKKFAKRHNVSVAFVYDQIKRGKLPARKAERATIITDEDVWLAQMPAIGATSDRQADEGSESRQGAAGRCWQGPPDQAGCGQGRGEGRSQDQRSRVAEAARADRLSCDVAPDDTKKSRPEFRSRRRSFFISATASAANAGSTKEVNDDCLQQTTPQDQAK